MSDSENRRKSHLVGVRMDPAEHQSAERAAQDAGVSLAELLRRSLAEVATLTAERDQLRGERDDLRGGLTAAAENVCARRNELDIVEAERDALAARLAQAERVVEAARDWRTGHAVIEDHGPLDDHEQVLAAAVDALDGTAGPGEEGSGDGR